MQSAETLTRACALQDHTIQTYAYVFTYVYLNIRVCVCVCNPDARDSHQLHGWMEGGTLFTMLLSPQCRLPPFSNAGTVELIAVVVTAPKDLVFPVFCAAMPSGSALEGGGVAGQSESKDKVQQGKGQDCFTLTPEKFAPVARADLFSGRSLFDPIYDPGCAASEAELKRLVTQNRGQKRRYAPLGTWIMKLRAQKALKASGPVIVVD